MTLEALRASLADRYRIERELGAGGMATVYLARDLRHDRDVAIKVLRPELAAVIGAERFLSEIRTTATLQHPHILPLFDSGEAGKSLFYVMPYVEGESLRERMVRERQLPVSDAVRIATEVASALDYAHRHGVIHRDIKPENILLHDGQALVADFGIALAASTAGTRMTETGMSLGTPHYMSPEQAMGEREITARSDVYALGAITYEMLIGEPPFTGPTAQAIIARVMTEEPRPVVLQRKSVPPYVEAAVFTALEKLPADRFSSAAEFASALKGEATTTRVIQRARGTAAPSRVRVTPAVMAGGVIALLVALAAGWLLRGAFAEAPRTPPIEFAFRMGTEAADRPNMTISPDGRRIVLAADDERGVPRLLLRDLGSTEIVEIAGSQGGAEPQFSHDGKWLAFHRAGQLHRIPMAGGPATLIVDSASPSSTWTPDDASVIYNRMNGGLWIVPVAGGSERRLTALDTVRREFAHWHPQVLPNGRTAIFTSYATPLSRARIEAVDLESGDRSVLVEGAVYAKYAASGYLLFARDEAVFAVPFDAEKVAVTGTPVPVLEDVAWRSQDGVAGYDVSENGTLVYLKASEWTVEREVVWVERSGNVSPALPRTGSWAQPRLSPDGRWIAVSQLLPKRDIWLFERARGVLTQLTNAPAAAFGGHWWPDSRSLVYSLESPVYDLHRILIDGSGADSSLVATPYDKRTLDISASAGLLAYAENGRPDRVMLMPVSGGTPRRLESNSGGQFSAAVSPSGRWIAYDEISGGGRPQVFVRSLTGGSGRIQVTPDGGIQPRWTKGGLEIVYRRGEAMLAVEFKPEDGTVGSPKELLRIADVGQIDGRAVGYDVTPDGSRFLMVRPIARDDVQPMHVIVNWLDVLRARMAQ